jgi:hypothetical protein
MKDLDLSNLEDEDLWRILKEHKACMERVQKQLLLKSAEKAVVETMPWTLCPIGLQLLQSPVQCSDGHTYSRHEIERWLATSDKSPMTNMVLNNLTLTPNHFARLAIEEAIQSKMKEIKDMPDSELNKAMMHMDIREPSIDGAH